MNRSLLAAVGGVLAAGAGFLLLRDQTTDNDQTGEDVGRIDVPRGSSGLGARAVEVLSRHVGEKGQGKKGTAGYHRSPFIDRVNTGVHGDGKSLIGKPWCARAVRFAYETAAQELGLPPPFSRIKGTLANVSSWKQPPFKAFMLSAPKVGAVLLLGERHATLIAQVLDGRTAVCCEGNHGDKVANVKRKIDPSQDTIVDVEAYAARSPATVGGDLDLLDAEALA